MFFVVLPSKSCDRVIGVLGGLNGRVRYILSQSLPTPVAATPMASRRVSEINKFPKGPDKQTFFGVNCVYFLSISLDTYADPRGTGGQNPIPLQNHKNIGFLNNTGPDLLKNHRATKPAVNVGPSSARQRNAIHNGVSMACR